MASTIFYGIELEILIEFEHRRDITSSTGTDTSPNNIPVSPELPIYSSGITQEASYHAGRIVMAKMAQIFINIEVEPRHGFRTWWFSSNQYPPGRVQANPSSYGAVHGGAPLLANLKRIGDFFGPSSIRCFPTAFYITNGDTWTNHTTLCLLTKNSLLLFSQPIPTLNSSHHTVWKRSAHLEILTKYPTTSNPLSGETAQLNGEQK
ncbi:hypothetical protein J7T55_010711 [Diaporthe amygdali]|uniref:uncharacterized protein n=1 Tax=Phomopsis amygdali TaxID=1214568 RepID=UPI0022FE7F68|nr:uncharacterized protein J7T55_010711 [Diaporthe amygdali]KAJ0114322.1 hypothetical protein J7T55_010711 [Diaporthe amygdali]